MLLGLILLLLAAPAGLAQPAPFTRDLYYTRTTSTQNLRHVTVTYATTPAPSITLSVPVPVATLAGADGLAITPDSHLLVGTPMNRINSVAPNAGAWVTTTVQAVSGVPGPTVGNVVLDPGLTRCWAVAPGPGGATPSQIVRVPLFPALSPGTAFTVSGQDTFIAHIAFGAAGRVFYVNPGTSPGTATLGTIDLTTFVTTRLLSNLPGAEQVVLDPDTGHLLVFGGTHILQVDPVPAIPVIVSDLDLTPFNASLNTSLNLRSGTPDGAGRLFALSSSGHLVFVDYSASGLVNGAGNVYLVGALESGVEDVAPLVGVGAPRASRCLWDNGAFDRRDGVPSGLASAPAGGDARTADDFYLRPGYHRIDAITATLFSDTTLPSGKIEVYSDCNGLPGTLLGSFAAALTDTGDTYGGLRVFSLRAATAGFWLRGGQTYWVSPVGIGRQTGTDQWYFGTAGNLSVRGTPGAFLAPGLGVPAWATLAGYPCGCTDFAFSVQGDSCKILRDNGEFDPAGGCAPSLVTGTAADVRSADNFAAPPCADERVCFIQSYLYTNCTPPRGQVEVYADSCNLPTGAPLFVAPFSLATDLGFSVVVSGSSLRAYRVEAQNIDWLLPAGHNYWLSVIGRGTGGFNQRACFPFNARCDFPGGGACSIHLSQGAVTTGGTGPTTWAKVQTVNGTARDFAFLIATRFADSPNAGQPGSTPPPTFCVADFDHSGQASIDDIFAYLTEWFAGCP